MSYVPSDRMAGIEVSTAALQKYHCLLLGLEMLPLQSVYFKLSASGLCHAQLFFYAPAA
jgi:hypothetical protein